ncbi:transporter substrate-binding domain-containing protein [Bacillus testis]|uniref:transporter substrate-binding domain-containing protein n=1 Tax=Bacillus testis TaxID=1622072 RepID=UPI000841006C|nr:transporter substrate-binding domain-containing protein [Bacillus testis]
MVRRRSLGIVVSVVMLIAVLTACGQKDDKSQDSWEKVKEKGKIVIGTSGTYYPMDYKDAKSNELTGFEVEIAKEFSKRLGVKAEFKTMEFDGILPALRNGQIDLAANNFTVNEERKKKFDFTIPYKYSYGTIVVRSSDSSGIKSVDDFKNKKFGGSPTSNFADFSRAHGAEVVSYTEGTDTILRDIAVGRIDGFLNDHLMIELALKQLNDDRLKMLGDIKFQPNVGVMVMKKDNDELKKKVDGAIKDMLEDGTIKKLSEKFLGSDVTKKVDEKDIVE